MKETQCDCVKLEGGKSVCPQIKAITDASIPVMAHIGRLRGKLNEPAKKPKFIKTVWGIGYEIE
mgnify:FL=1